jgi:hypothetical protein
LRRGSISLALGALLLGALAVAALLVAAAQAPERLRQEVERRLAEAAGVPVHVAAVRMRFAQGLALELADCHAAAPEGVALRATRVRAGIDPVALALGRLSLGTVVLEGLDLVLPPLAADADTAATAALPADALVATLGALAGAAEDVALPVRSLELRRGRLRIAGGEQAGAAGAWVISDAHGALRQSRLRARTELFLEARVGEGGDGAGSLALDATSSGGSLDAKLSLRDVALAPLAPLTSALGWKSPEGPVRVSGALGWTVAEGAPHRVDVSLRATGLAAGVRDAAPASTLASGPLELVAHLEAHPTRLRLLEGRLSDGDVVVRAEGAVELPLRDHSALRLGAELGGVALADVPLLAARLPLSVREGLPPLFATVEAGELVYLRLDGEASLAGWREFAGGGLLAQPGAVRLGLAVAGVRLRVGAGDVIDGVSGSLAFDGDALDLRGLRGSFRGSPLPRVDGTFRGLAHVRSASELDCVPPPPASPLPGARSLLEWLSDPDDEPEDWGWQHLAIEADWVAHPTLLCSLEQVAAELRPAHEGLDVTLHSGVWAGVPVTGRAAYREPPQGDATTPDPTQEGHVAFEVAIGPPFEGMSPDPPADPWLRGRFEAATSHLGPWRIQAASGSFRASGSILHLDDASVALAPGGSLSGGLALDLGAPGPLPLRLAVQIEGIEILDFLQAVSLDSDFLSGTLHGAAVLDGHLQRGRSVLETADGLLTLHARKGRIRKEIPALMAVAVASQRWNPFEAHDEIPYDAIDLVARASAGTLESEVLHLEGRTVRMVGSGRLGIESPHPLELVLGIFFFPGLDSVIDRFPIVNRVLLGANRNLMGAYYALQGPFARPRARLIPIKTLAAGPASFVLEDVPGFVWGSLKRIQAVLAPRGDAVVEVPERPRADS